jgi:glycosyltransferase involved in cell wall biosynthesis
VVRHRCKRGSLAASVLAGVEMYTHKWLEIYERNVDLFITPSQFLKDKALEYGVENPIVHLPNFIKVDQIQPCSEPENYFVYSGRLVAVKGVRTLLAAMRAVPQSHLYIAGSGELEPELKEYVHRHHLTNVTFLGHLDTEALMTLVQRAQFVVAPSEWYENYPMAVLEALACATPVIGARIGGIPEIVIDGETGLLFESGNVDQLAAQIRYLLEHRDEAIRMGQAGRARVAHYNHPDYHYEKTLEVYQQLVKNPTGTV